MGTKQMHIVFPADLIAEIDRLVGKRERSRLVARAAWQEVKRLQQLEALKKATGAWCDNDHPELKQGAARWIRRLRRESDKRLERLHRQ
jgi:hypothetical protein